MPCIRGNPGYRECMRDKHQSKLPAEEKLRTKKIREKLQKRLREMDQSITPQALEKKSREIHRWICLHAHCRVMLKSKAVSLFDENRNAAKLSQKVSQFSLRLKKFLDQNVPKPTKSCAVPFRVQNEMLK